MVAALVTVLLAAGGLVFSPLLDVDRVSVRGADDRAAEVVVASGIEIGSPILFLDARRAERRIRALPWVGDVRVERALLGTVRIAVRSSVPVAWLRADDGTVTLVDARGRPRSSVPDPPATLPELVVAPAGTDSGAATSPRAEARIAASLGTLAGKVASIEVVDGLAVLRVVGGPEIRLGRVTRLAEKTRAASALLGAIGSEGAAYIDVSAPAAPVTG